MIGVRRTRRIGQDSDFERLRDYSRDDNFRHIDWRSTARRSKLTVRQFQSDQSQRVIFLLDCGRMMTNTRDGYTLLDRGWTKAHRELSRWDIVMGLVIPYILVTSLVSIAAAGAFYGSDLSIQGKLSPAQEGMMFADAGMGQW